MLGFASTHERKIDALGAERTATFSVTLDEGTAYRIVAVCDHDCGDVDMEVFDENDNEVAEDSEDDPRPVASITPRWTGTFRVEVTMFDCRTKVCYYGVGVFGK